MIHRRHDCLRVALLVRLFVASPHHSCKKCEKEALCRLTKSGHISLEMFGRGGDRLLSSAVAVLPSVRDSLKSWRNVPYAANLTQLIA